MCRYGTYCTFAHGENELKSWMGYQRQIQEAESEDKLTSKKPETRAGISRIEVQPPYQVSNRYIIRAWPSVNMYNTYLAWLKITLWLVRIPFPVTLKSINLHLHYVSFDFVSFVPFALGRWFTVSLV